MNKIYSKIWSKTQGRIVVASELARSHSKGGRGASRNRGCRASRKGVTVKTLIAASGLILAGSASAAMNTWDLSDGTNTTTVSDGDTITLNGDSNLGVTVNGDDVNFVLDDSLTGIREIVFDSAIGGTGKNKITEAIATTYSLANTAKSDAAAAGAGWKLSADHGDSGTATVKPTDQVDFASGDNIKVSRDGNKIAVATVDTPNFQGADMGGDKITDVGAGDISSSSSTDAVNGGQLYDALYGASSSGIRYFHANSTKNDSQANGTDSVAIGPETKAGGESSFAAGHGADIDGTAKNAVALGTDSSVGVNANSAVAIGDGASAGKSGEAWESLPKQSVAIGYKSKSSGSYAIGIGANSHAGSTDAIAIGREATANGQYDVALGRRAGLGTGGGSGAGDRHDHIAIGYNAGRNVDGNETIAIGRNAGSNVSNNYNIAIGSQAGKGINGERNISLGYEANANAGKIDHGISIGDLSSAGTNGVSVGYKSHGEKGSLALGEGATSKAENGVALGIHATVEQNAGDFVALGDNSVATNNDIQNPSYLTGKNFTGSAVSVGNSDTGLYRRIVNVADGAADHDAVNVAQLKKLKDKLGSFTPTSGGNVNYNSDNTITTAQAKLGDQAVNLDQMNAALADQKVQYFSVNPNGATSNKDNSGALGAGSANSMAIGHAAQTQGQSSLSIGHSAHVTNADRATSVGENVNVKADDGTAMGSGSVVDNKAGVAIGKDAYSRGENSLAMGTDAQTDPKNSGGATSDNAIAFGSHSRATDDNATAMGHTAKASGESSTAIGHDSKAMDVNALATGTRSKASSKNSQASGTDAVASATNAIATGTGAVAERKDAIAMGTDAHVDAPKGVAIGANANASNARSVALGDGARTAAAVGTSSATVDHIKYNFAGTQPIGTVSVGTGDGDKRTITNVAAGRINENSTDAINGSQLYATNQAVDALGDDLDTAGGSVADALGGDSSYDPDTHKVTASLDVNGNNYDNVQDALDYVGQGWDISAQGNNSTNVGPGDSVDLNNNDGNIVVSKTANSNDVTFDLADSITVGSNGGNNPVTIDGNAGTIGGLTNKTFNPDSYTSGQAATEDQLAGTYAAGLDFSGNTGSTHRDLGTKLAITGGNVTGGSYSGDNLKTVTDDNGVHIQMADTPHFQGADMGGEKITNVGAGDVSAGSTDAVNGSQLNDVKNTAEEGWYLTDSGGQHKSNVGPGDTVDLSNNDGNIKVNNTNGNVTFDLADNLTVGPDSGGHPITIDGDDGHIGGLTNKTFDPGNYTSGQAATEDQLAGTYAAGLDFSGNTGSTHRDLGTKLAITGGNVTGGSYSGDNLKTVTDDDGVHIQMAENPNFTSIQLGGNKGPVLSNDNGNAQVGDSNGNPVKITNLADGENPHDAVNLSQLNSTTHTIHDYSVNSIDPSTDSNYDNSGATGNNALAAGVSATAGGSSAIAVGYNVTASGDDAIVIGSNSGASSNDSNVAIGAGTGNNVTTSANIAMGGAAGSNVVSGATGYNPYRGVTGNNVAIGGLAGSDVIGDTNVAMGWKAGWKQYGNANVAMGPLAGYQQHGSVNVSIGSSAGRNSTGMGNVSVGNFTGAYTNATYTVNLGMNATAHQDNGMALGAFSSSDGTGAIALGANAEANGEQSISVGVGNKVNGDNSGAFGDPSVINGGNSYAVGNNNTVDSDGVFVLGNNVNVGTGYDGNVVLGSNATTDTQHVPAGSNEFWGVTTPAGLTSGATTVSVGAPGDERQIQNVAPGVVSQGSTDAINGSQLYGVQQLASKGWNLQVQDGSVENIAPGDTLNVRNTDGNFVMSSSSDANGVHTRTFDLAPVVTVGNTNPITIDGEVGTIGGLANTSWNDWGPTDGEGEANEDYDPSLAASQGELADVADGLTTAGLDFAGNTGSTHRDLGTTLAITGGNVTGGSYSGDNLKTVTDDEGVHLLIADSPMFGGLTVTGETQLGDHFHVDEQGNVTYDVTLNDETDGNSIVNKKYVDGLGDELTRAGLNFAGDTGGTVHRNLGQTLNIVGGATDGLTHDNIGVVADEEGNLNVLLAQNIDLGDDGSIQIGNTTVNNNGLTIENGPSVTQEGIDAGGQKITNVARGTDGTDAVNVDQLTEATEEVADNISSKGMNFAGNEGNNVHRDLGQTLTIEGSATTAGDYSSNNVKTVTRPEKGTLEIQIAESPKFGDVTINDGGSGKITGVAAGDIAKGSKDAVNGGQIYELRQTANAGWNLLVNGDDKKKVAPADNVNFKSSDGNIRITKTDEDSTHNLDFRLSDDVTIGNSLTVGGGTVITGDGLSVGDGGPSITSNGIDAGGQRITHVAPGVAPDDAATVGQLNSALGGIQSDINGLHHDIRRMGRNAYAGVASAMAMASLPQAYEPGQSAGAISYGTYHGQSAMALGVSTITDNGRYVFKLNLSENTMGHYGVGAGAAIVW